MKRFVCAARQRMRVFFLPLTAMMMLGACSATGLVSPYDAEIDKGVMQYAVDVEEHLLLQVLKKEQPGYVYAQDLRFYAKQKATLSGLIMRAEAADPGRGCTISDAAAKYFGNKLPGELSSVVKNINPAGDGCTVILLKNIRAQLDQIAALEKAMNGLNSAAATDALKISNQAVRALLALEGLKKKGLEK